MSTHYQKASGNATHEDLIFRKRSTGRNEPTALGGLDHEPEERQDLCVR